MARAARRSRALGELTDDKITLEERMPILTQKQVQNIAQHRSQARLEGAASRVHASSEALHYALANYAEEGLVTDDLEVRGKLLDEVTRCIHDCAKKRDAECEELKRIETRSAMDELAALQLEAGIV